MRLEHWFYTIPLRVRSLFRRYRVEDELDEELQFHLEQRMAQERAGGKTAEEARSIALQSMEGLEQRKEECRDMRGVNLFDDLQRNLGYAVRGLLRNPGFTAVTVITLALGIGSTSAIFSLVDTVMLRLLPVKAPEQLYLLGHKPEPIGMAWNYPDYNAMREENSVFTGLATYSLGHPRIGVQTGNTGGFAAELTYSVFVSGNYFQVLGVSPALGRTFNSADDRAPGAAPYLVISYSYWRTHFNRDMQVIGRELKLNGYPFTISGVAPPSFTGADVAFKPDLFIPIMMYGEVMHTLFDNWKSRHWRWVATIGRMKTDTPIKKAEAELFAICKEQEAAERRSLANPKLAQAADRVVLVPAAHGFSYNADTIKKPLLILFAAVVLVLFIACANAANLMLARGAARQREIAVRLAIGASRWRVISQLLTESLLIAALGGASGILVSLAGVRVLSWFMPNPGGNPANGIDPTLDWRVVAFTVTVCVLTGILSGLAPAWQSTRPDLVPTLKEDVPGSTGGGRFTLRKGLVILQVALSLPLLAGAGLFARTLGNLRGLDSGFVQQNVSIASVDPMSFGYKAQRTRDFYDQLCARVAALPGVRSASLTEITPLSGSSWNGRVWVEGYPTPSEKNNIFLNAAGARYFETMGTPVILGRDFIEQDSPAVALELPEHLIPGQHLPDAPGKHVAIVNEAFARHFFGTHSALGMHVGMDGNTSGDKLYEIVGVVKDARYFNMRETAEPMMFIPIWRRFVHRSELVIRTSGSTAQLAALLRREIHALDPVIPLENLHTLEHDIDENILVERMVATLSGVFGVLALLLSAVGLYGVIAYTVTRRTREIGIRIAIGAPRQSVLWLALRDVLSMVLIGGVIGSLAAFLATRAIASILYGVSAHDPLSLMAAGLSLAAAALVASFLPARRATKIDPTVALRYE